MRTNMAVSQTNRRGIKPNSTGAMTQQQIMTYLIHHANANRKDPNQIYYYGVVKEDYDTHYRWLAGELFKYHICFEIEE